MLIVRSFLFNVGQLSFTFFLFLPFCLLISPLQFNRRYFLFTYGAAFSLWWLRICCGIQYEIKGLENIPKTPGVVMCKHQSAFETLLLQRIFIPQVWILKRELLYIPIYGWVIACMRPIVIDRASVVRSLRQVLRQGCIALRKKRWIIIFPEGTRVAPGAKGTYRSSGSELAKQSGVNVTPVAHNAGYLWRRNSFVKKPGRVTLVIGPAIQSANKDAKQITQEVETWIEDTVQTLPDPAA